MIDDISAYFIGLYRRVVDTAGRATSGPILVRGALWAATIGALALAFPAKAVPTVPGLFGIAVVGLVPALGPRTRAVTAVLLLCVFGWLVSTIGYEDELTIARLVGLALALYLVHNLAALASVLPYDVVVSPGVLAGWLLRTAGVLAGGAVFGVTTLSVTGLVAGPTYLAAAVVGLAAVGLLAWFLARRIDSGDRPH